MSEGFISTSHGRIHYVRQGSGPPLILLHSNGNSVHEWSDVLDGLAASFDVIAWDQPGQGDSDWLGRHTTIDEYTDCLVELMDGLGVDSAAVAGTSIGAFFVVSLAARYPARVTHAVPIEGMCRTDAEWAAHWDYVDGNFGNPTQDHAAVAARFNEVSPDFLRRWNTDRNKAGAKAMMSTMWAIREYDLPAWAQKVTTPTLLMYGTSGPTIATREPVEAAISNCEVSIFENSGHFPMNDEPEKFIAVITQFCSQS